MDIQFKVTEVNGTKSPSEWFAQKVKDYAKDQYGLDIKIEIISKTHSNKNDLSSTL